MNRRIIESVKTEAHRLLVKIDMMERCAGWTIYTQDVVQGMPHPKDRFEYGQYTAAVKRASMDLSRALVEIRR